MSDYFTTEDLKALLPNEWMLGALDDDRNGSAEMLTQARDVATSHVNAIVSLRYALPLAEPLPLLVKNAALYVAVEICYGRRGMIEAFPFQEALSALRKQLQDVAAGKVPLYPTAGAPAPGASSSSVGKARVISVKNPTYDPNGRLSS